MRGALPRDKGKKDTPPEPSSTVVFMTIADTSWRMFVPSLGFTFLGIWCDEKLQTSPWLLFTGILVGLTVGALAVKLQLNKITKS